MRHEVYRIAREGYAPDEEFEWQAYAADDGVGLALQGTYGTLAAIAQNVGEFLQRYESGATAMPPAA